MQDEQGHWFGKISLHGNLSEARGNFVPLLCSELSLIFLQNKLSPSTYGQEPNETVLLETLRHTVSECGRSSANKLPKSIGNFITSYKRYSKPFKTLEERKTLADPLEYVSHVFRKESSCCIILTSRLLDVTSGSNPYAFAVVVASVQDCTAICIISPAVEVQTVTLRYYTGRRSLEIDLFHLMSQLHRDPRLPAGNRQLEAIAMRLSSSAKVDIFNTADFTDSPLPITSLYVDKYSVDTKPENCIGSQKQITAFQQTTEKTPEPSVSETHIVIDIEGNESNGQADSEPPTQTFENDIGELRESIADVEKRICALEMLPSRIASCEEQLSQIELLRSGQQALKAELVDYVQQQTEAQAATNKALFDEVHTQIRDNVQNNSITRDSIMKTVDDYCNEQSKKTAKEMTVLTSAVEHQEKLIDNLSKTINNSMSSINEMHNEKQSLAISFENKLSALSERLDALSERLNLQQETELREIYESMHKKNRELKHDYEQQLEDKQSQIVALTLRIQELEAVNEKMEHTVSQSMCAISEKYNQLVNLESVVSAMNSNMVAYFDKLSADINNKMRESHLELKSEIEEREANILDKAKELASRELYIKAQQNAIAEREKEIMSAALNSAESGDSTYNTLRSISEGMSKPGSKPSSPKTPTRGLDAYLAFRERSSSAPSRFLKAATPEKSPLLTSGILLKPNEISLGASPYKPSTSLSRSLYIDTADSPTSPRSSSEILSKIPLSSPRIDHRQSTLFSASPKEVSGNGDTRSKRSSSFTATDEVELYPSSYRIGSRLTPPTTPKPDTEAVHIEFPASPLRLYAELGTGKVPFAAAAYLASSSSPK